MKQLNWICAAIALVAGMPAMADVTVGQLSRATGSQVIVDNLNQREWLGFDVTRNLTYAQALAATAQGGQFEGYKIATVADGALFAAAAGGACTDPNYSYCLSGQPDLEQVTGESYYAPGANGGGYDYDYAWLLSDGQYGGQVGFLEVFTSYGGAASQSTLNLMSHWSEFGSADYYSSQPSISIGWLMYHDGTSHVPEPASLALAGMALAAVAATRRRARR